MGYKAAMLTGDTLEAGTFVAQALGIEEELCHFGMTPEQKREWVSTRAT